MVCIKFTVEQPCQSAIPIKLLCNFVEIVFWHWRSPANLLHIFRTPFPKNTPGGLFLTRVRLIGKIDQNDTILWTRCYDSTNTNTYRDGGRGGQKYLFEVLFSLSCSIKAENFTKVLRISFLQGRCERCFCYSLIFKSWHDIHDIRRRNTSAIQVVYLWYPK